MPAECPARTPLGPTSSHVKRSRSRATGPKVPTHSACVTPPPVGAAARLHSASTCVLARLRLRPEAADAQAPLTETPESGLAPLDPVIFQRPRDHARRP